MTLKMKVNGVYDIIDKKEAKKLIDTDKYVIIFIHQDDIGVSK